MSSSPRPYDHHWQQVRLVVLDRDQHHCQLQLAGCTGHATHVDHIVPLSEGGARLDPDTLRASCRPCNLRRNRLRQAELARVKLAELTSTHTPSRRW